LCPFHFRSRYNIPELNDPEMCVPVQEHVEHSDVENSDMSLRSNVACDASLSEKQDLSLTYRKEVYNNDMTDNKVLRKL